TRLPPIPRAQQQRASQSPVQNTGSYGSEVHRRATQASRSLFAGALRSAPPAGGMPATSRAPGRAAGRYGRRPSGCVPRKKGSTRPAASTIEHELRRLGEQAPFDSALQLLAVGDDGGAEGVDRRGVVAAVV